MKEQEKFEFSLEVFWGLGTLIGEPCGNSPSHYGQPIDFSLEHSYLSGRISHKAFTRPNGDWSEKALLTDVETEDLYQTAIDFFDIEECPILQRRFVVVP